MKNFFDMIDKNDVLFFIMVVLAIMIVAILQIILWGKKEDWETCKSCGGLSNFLIKGVCQDCVEDLLGLTKTERIF